MSLQNAFSEESFLAFFHDAMAVRRTPPLRVRLLESMIGLYCHHFHSTVCLSFGRWQ